MKPICDRCKYFIGGMFGTCHRYPHAAEVASGHWCGEFKSVTSTEKVIKPKVSKDDMSAVVGTYKTCFQAKYGVLPTVSKIDYAAAKKMILEDGVDKAVNYVKAFFSNMPHWNYTNNVFDLKVIPGIRNKLMLAPAARGESTVEEFLASCSDGERHSRLWNEYSDYVKKTGNMTPMKEWLTVNG